MSLRGRARVCPCACAPAALTHVLLTEQNPNYTPARLRRQPAAANPPPACSGGIIKPANPREDKGVSERGGKKKRPGGGEEEGNGEEGGSQVGSGGRAARALRRGARAAVRALLAAVGAPPAPGHQLRNLAARGRPACPRAGRSARAAALGALPGCWALPPPGRGRGGGAEARPWVPVLAALLAPPAACGLVLPPGLRTPSSGRGGTRVPCRGSEEAGRDVPSSLGCGGRAEAASLKIPPVKLSGSCAQEPASGHGPLLLAPRKGLKGLNCRIWLAVSSTACHLKRQLHF